MWLVRQAVSMLRPTTIDKCKASNKYYDSLYKILDYATMVSISIWACWTAANDLVMSKPCIMIVYAISTLPQLFVSTTANESTVNTLRLMFNKLLFTAGHWPVVFLFQGEVQGYQGWRILSAIVVAALLIQTIDSYCSPRVDTKGSDNSWQSPVGGWNLYYGLRVGVELLYMLPVAYVIPNSWFGSSSHLWSMILAGCWVCICVVHHMVWTRRCISVVAARSSPQSSATAHNATLPEPPILMYLSFLGYSEPMFSWAD